MALTLVVLTPVAEEGVACETLRERATDGMLMGVLVLDTPPNAVIGDEAADNAEDEDTGCSSDDEFDVEVEDGEDGDMRVDEVDDNVCAPAGVVELAAGAALVAAASALLKALADFAPDGVVGVDRTAFDIWAAFAGSICSAAESALVHNTGDS